MPANLLPWQKYRIRKKLTGPQSRQDDIPLSQMGMGLSLQDQIVNDDGQQRTYWRLVLCYSLHAFLVFLHLVLLGIAVAHHAERRIIIQNDIKLFTTGLSGGLQTFYTLYTALLVFITQRLMLSSIFTSPKKLTQIHDICGAWAGLGSALSALWQQTKVTSSILSISVVTAYFVCISVLHVTSTTLVQLQLFNDTVTKTGPVLGTWPNASIDIASLDWTTVTALVPFLQDLYGNTTDGLANNTLYDVPVSDFIDATVPATTVNAQCGLLTNLSIGVESNFTDPSIIISPRDSRPILWYITASMSTLGSIAVEIAYQPLPNQIWFPPSIQRLQPIYPTLILYLTTADIEVDVSLGGVNHVYMNGSDGVAQNFSTPIYLIACSLNSTNHVVTLDASGIQLNSSVQPTDVAWPVFSPGGDPNLTSGISFAMTSANSLPMSPYCQPVVSGASLQTVSNMTAFNVYISSLLGLDISACTGGQYTSVSPLKLTKYQVESVVSQTAAKFLWLAGELGADGGGFDRQMEEAPILLSMVQQWKLNINLLPIILALCVSVMLFVLVVFALWRYDQTPVFGAGVLEMMWFGSCSPGLRSHLSGVQTPSLESLRASSMFETIFWAPSTRRYEGSSVLHTPAPLQYYNLETPGYETETPHLGDVSRDNTVHKLSIPGSHLWCYALHIMLVALCIVLLTLLVHHPEQSVVIPSKTTTLTVGLSALLQGVYTLYSAILVLLMQRLALFKIVGKRQKLTAVHDVSGAWTGIGAAINILWKQRKVSSLTWEVICVGVYLMLMLTLHITSSSIMQWQAFNSTITNAIQTNLVFPDSAVNIDQFAWVEIFSIVHSIGQDSTLSTYGLSNTTLYDVLRNPGDITFTSATVNATTLTAQCSLVPNLTLSYPSVGYSSYLISFQNGTNNGSFLASALWKDVVYGIQPSTQCIACPQTLFYMITTSINVDESADESVVVGLNWTYTPPGGNPQNSTTATYIAACSLNAQTVPAVLDVQHDVLETVPNQTTVGPATSSWSVWSPGNATNLSVELMQIMTTPWRALTSANQIFLFDQGYFSSDFTDMDQYMMSLLGLNLSYANATSASQSSVDPTVTLSPWQLENAIAQTAAKLLWVAGQVGENGGGFQRFVGESQATRNIIQFRLHLNTIPVLLASVAAFLSLILAMFITGKPSGKRVALVSGTSVLECLWLEAHSESIHTRMETIREPDLDKLREAGMFDICLGDIGRSSYPEVNHPFLEPERRADE